MKHLFVVIVLVMSSCATVQERSPFYDIREAQGIMFYVCDAALLPDLVAAMEAYAPVYGYTQEDIERAILPVAGELYVTDTAVKHYLNFKQKEKHVRSN